MPKSRSETETLTLRQLSDMLQLSETTLKRRHRDGQLPPPLVLSPHKLLWSRRSIEEWLRSPPAAPDARARRRAARPTMARLGLIPGAAEEAPAKG